MPFGITPAPEIFQMKLDQNLEGLKGVFKIADDILITSQGETEREADEDHDRNLKSLLDRCREWNIKLNKKKFTFKCDDVQFIGHRLTKEGLKPDPAKVKAILSMKKPDDIAAVQRLMGMVNYLSKFLVDLFQICEPTRRLTHKDEPWDGQKNRMLPLARSRKQLPLPQSSSTLTLACPQKEVEMLLHKDLILYSHRKTTPSPMQAGL